MSWGATCLHMQSAACCRAAGFRRYGCRLRRSWIASRTQSCRRRPQVRSNCGGSYGQPARSSSSDWRTLAYYVGCQAGFVLRLPQSGISFFWPPTALLTVALLLVPRIQWPGLLIAALLAHAVAHASDGVPPGAWLIQFAGNAVQAVLAAVCANCRSRIDHLFSDVRSTLAFIAGACIGAPAIASLIPAGVYVQLGWATGFWDAWLTRTITNAVASMTLIPSLFIAGRVLFTQNATRYRLRPEFALLMVGIIGVHLLTVLRAPGDMLGLSVSLYAPLPFLLWAVIRCGASGLSFALLATTLLTIATAVGGYGPFVARLSAETVLGVQIFMGSSAALMLLIAGLLEEQRTGHARLIEAARQNGAITTRLQAAQQRYELATAAGGVGVWQWNLRNGEIRVEGDLKRLLGYRDDEIQDDLADWMRLIAPIDRREVQTRVDDFLTGTLSSLDAEFRMLHRDGSQRWIAVKGAHVHGGDAAIVQATGTYADVTDRNEAERALRDATDALARTSRVAAMTELSASLAHELSQPLTAIVANANACLIWIEGGAGAAELKQTLQDILQDGRRATQIVARTRDMFANRSTQPAPLNVNEVVRDILELAQSRLREWHIAVDLTLDDSIPRVFADTVQIRQVIVNLVVNAAEAMRATPSPRRLSISSRHARGMVIVNVRDTGPGFTHHERRRLFEPFYTTKSGGVGMGLAICRSIMLNCNGTLQALMNREQGATFRIKLPAAELPIDMRNPALPRRMLVVDEHEGMRTALARLLRLAGHEIVEATHVAEALAVAQTFRPDSAVIDVSGGNASAVDLARQLRRQHVELRLLALTAERDADLRTACLDAGFDAYLVKPEGITRIQQYLE
jgi:two-component system, LuxR family, sensor kinase FixL